MLLGFIIGATIAVIILAVVIDAGTGYLQDRPTVQVSKSESKQVSRNDSAEMKQSIAAYRHMKRIELGLLKTCQRNRQEAQHRRLQAS